MPVHTLEMDAPSRLKLRPSPESDDRDRIFPPQSQTDSEQGEQTGRVSPFSVSHSGLRETLDRTSKTVAPARDALDMSASRSHPFPNPTASRVGLARDSRTADALHSLAELSAAASQHGHPAVQPSVSPEDASQQSGNTVESNGIFSPPASQPGTNERSNSHVSSQESQLLQLSQVAASQDKMTASDYGPSRKRMADGEVKERGSASPARGGHSRNTSAVSMASTTASTIGDLSTDLKTRLSYAMVKLNHGWQSHSIEEVESMASQAGSPTSSHSTLHGRNGSSASPQLATASRNLAYSAAASSNPSPVAAPDIRWREGGPTVYQRRNSASSPEGTSNVPALAPPARIQPSRPIAGLNPRRNSNVRHTPTLLSNAHSASASPRTPALPHTLQGTPDQRPGGRTPAADPILFSPHQNVREKDAIETLLFMSSPGNSANMKHGYVPASASQPASTARHALPTSQPRKTLPNHRPQGSQKRVEFEKSPSTVSDMDIDSESRSRTPRGAVRRRVNGGSSTSYSTGGVIGHRNQMSLPAGLGSGQSQPRPRLADEDVERMLDRVAQADNDSSDDDEIQIPDRREGAGVAG